MKPAALQLEDPVGSTGQLLVVRHQNHAEALARPEAKQEIVQILTCLCVQVARRLVGKKQQRLGCKSPRNRDALLFSTGKLSRAMGRPVVEADLRKQVPRSLVRRRSQPSGNQTRHHHILQRCKLSKEVVELEDEPHSAVSHSRKFILIHLR
jgi:hypothetical protein